MEVEEPKKEKRIDKSRFVESRDTKFEEPIKQEKRFDKSKFIQDEPIEDVEMSPKNIINENIINY